MNTSTQKRNGNDRSSTMHNFLDNSIAAERLENFFQDLVEEVRSGKTPIAPESMGNTDAVFTMDVILKLLENRAVNSLTPEKNVSSDVYTVRPFSFRDWKMTAGFTPQLKLQKWWARVNPQLKPGKIPISYLLLILTVSFTTRCFSLLMRKGSRTKACSGVWPNC